MLLRGVLGRSICKGTWISDVTKVVGAKLALPQPEGSLTSSGFPCASLTHAKKGARTIAC